MKVSTISKVVEGYTYWAVEDRQKIRNVIEHLVLFGTLENKLEVLQLAFENTGYTQQTVEARMQADQKELQ